MKKTIEAEIAKTDSGGTAIVNSGQYNMSGAETDDQMVDLFVATRRSPSTREVYSRSIEDFRQFTDYKPLQMITVTDLNR